MKLKSYCFLVMVIFMSVTFASVNAQNSHNITRLNQYYHNWGDGVKDVTIKGDYAYLACGEEGLRIINISTPAAISDVGQLTCPGLSSTLAISGNYAYIGGYDSGLHIIDITNLSSPQLAATVPMTQVSINAIRISGDYAFVCGQWSGLTIINISNPSSPAIVWSSLELFEGMDVDIHGDRVYIAASSDGLMIYDISNIASPQFLGVYESYNGYYINGVSVSGNYAYIAAGGDGFQVINLTTMQLVSSVDSLVFGFRVKVVDNYAYYTYGDPECPLAIIDISNPISPQVTGIYYPPEDIVNFDIVGDMAYVAAFNHGLRAVDISDRQNPHEAFCYSRYGRDYGVTVVGNCAYVKEVLKIKAIDIADIYNPRELGYFESNWQINDFDISGNVGFTIQMATTYLHAIDLTNPANLTVLGTFSDSYNDVHYRMAIYNNYGYLVENNGLRIVDISDPANITAVGFFERNNDNASIMIYDHFLFMEKFYYQFGIEVYDLTQPLAPSYVGFYQLDNYCRQMKVSGNTLYLTTGNKLYLFDISSNNNWDPLSITTMPAEENLYLNGFAVDGNYVYLTGNSLGLRIYNVSDRSNPVCTGYYQTSSEAHDVAVVGNIAIVANYDHLAFFDCGLATGIEDNQSQVPGEFALLPNYPNPFNSATQIQFDLPKSGHVNLAIYDILGRAVATLADGDFASGRHAVRWDGTNGRGQSVASGRYYIQAKTDNQTKSIPVSLLK
jgi:hypothetical protein